MVLCCFWAEELSCVVGAAFRMAYAQQLAQPLAVVTPPTSETRLCRGRRCSPLSTHLLASPGFGRATCRSAGAHSSSRSPARVGWAKKLAGQANHQDAIAKQALEMSIRSEFSAPCSSRRASNVSRQNPLNRIRDNVRPPGTLPVVDVSSLQGGSSSSEESNSPTDLNSCKQIKDKPPLHKNLEVVQENNILEGAYAAEASKPPSVGYINEGASWDGTSVLGASALSDDAKMKSCNLLSRKKFPLASGEKSRFALPTTDEEYSLESSSGNSSKRSSRSSCDQNNSLSLSDMQGMDRGSNGSSHPRSNPSSTPPPPPERHDSLSVSLSEERELRRAPWFQAGIPREIALEILSQEPIGSFMVRESTSKPGCFALSMHVPYDFHESGIAHYLIMKTNRGYKIKGFTKEFVTLTALITHHSVMPELLPCPLLLSKYNPTFKKHDSEDMVDMNEDPEYNLLSDFRKMLSDVNV